MSQPSLDLPDFPVDDVTLSLVDHALGARLTYEGTDGDSPRVIGADMTLSTLLDFLSGYDPTQVRPLGENIVEYVGGPLYTRDDVIRALIAEVRRLKATP